MQLYAYKTFRLQSNKGATVAPGDKFEVDDNTGNQLVRLGIAGKSMKDYENKMEKEFQDKKLPTKPESSDVRAQGKSKPSAKSETPEERSQGKGGPAKKQSAPSSGLPGREIKS